MANINFIGKRRQFGALSVVLVTASIILIAVKGVNKSVDFAGGSQVTVQFPNPDLDTGLVRASVNHIDSKAQIVRNGVSSGSSFTVKIKNPDVEEGKETEASRTRRRKLEAAFAELGAEKNELLTLIGTLDAESLKRALILENPFALNDTDAVIAETYQGVADKLAAGVSGAADLEALVESVDATHKDNLIAGLELAFPAINRSTSELLDAMLTKQNPLGRALDAHYQDIATQIMAYREQNNDFVQDMSAMIASLNVQDGEDKVVLASFIGNHFRMGQFNVTANETFSPSIASELLTHAWEAILLAMAGILFYITIRFTLGYALASIIALAHDVTIALGAFSLVGLELSNPVVAAFLTIIGYSLNDTIVVFDRIRDNLNGVKKPDMASLLNRSINETLSRTLVTSLTTLFVVLVIFVGANVTLSDFAFPLLIGIIVGTYSSIFVASPCLLLWNDRFRSIST